MQGLVEQMHGYCPDISTLGGPHILKKDALKGDLHTRVMLLPAVGYAIKTEQHTLSTGQKLYDLHLNMIGNNDPTCAQVFGVQIKEIKLKHNLSAKFCEVTTWVELLVGEAPTALCLTVSEASQLYHWALNNATWLHDDPRENVHGDLHPDNVRLFCDKGQYTLKVFDFGNAVRDWSCEGDIRAFSSELYEYVRNSLFFFLDFLSLLFSCFHRFFFVQLISAPRSDKFRLAAFIFNFLAGRPVPEVPGYEKPLSACEAELQRKAVALENEDRDLRTMAWLLGSPKEDDCPFKIHWADDSSPAKRRLHDLFADVEERSEEDDTFPKPKRLCFEDSE
jgi:hypothetical protein